MTVLDKCMTINILTLSTQLVEESVAIQFCKEYESKTNLSMPVNIAQKGVFDAFKYSSYKTYPTIPSEWKVISYRAAVLKLDSFCSKQTLIKMTKQGYFRTDAKGHLYEDEIQKLVEILEIGKILRKAGIIVDTKDLKGNGVYAIMNKSVNTLRKSKQYQDLKSIATTIQAPFFKHFFTVCETEDPIA